VDPEEVAKFGAVSADDWWNPDSTSGVGVLHRFNPARMQFIREQVIRHFYPHTNTSTSDDVNWTYPLKGLRVLDVGSGGGIAAEALARMGATVTAIDPAPENVHTSSTHAKLDPRTQGIEYRCMTVEQLVEEMVTSASNKNLPPTYFDIVCSLDVIEHVNDPKLFVQSLTKLVHPTKGQLFLSTINQTPESFALAIVALEYLTRLAPVGTHEWSKFMSPEQIAQLLEPEGFDVQEVSGIVGEPLFRKKFTLSKNCTGINYIMSATPKPVHQ